MALKQGKWNAFTQNIKCPLTVWGGANRIVMVKMSGLKNWSAGTKCQNNIDFYLVFDLHLNEASNIVP